LAAENTFVLLAAHWAVNQIQELMLGKLALTRHSRKNRVPDIPLFSRVACLGSNAGLLAIERTVEEEMVVTLLLYEPLLPKRSFYLALISGHH